MWMDEGSGSGGERDSREQVGTGRGVKLKIYDQEAKRHNTRTTRDDTRRHETRRDKTTPATDGKERKGEKLREIELCLNNGMDDHDGCIREHDNDDNTGEDR